jgi:hypothetical protein
MEKSHNTQWIHTPQMAQVNTGEEKNSKTYITKVNVPHRKHKNENSYLTYFLDSFPDFKSCFRSHTTTKTRRTNKQKKNTQHPLSQFYLVFTPTHQNYIIWKYNEKLSLQTTQMKIWLSFSTAVLLLTLPTYSVSNNYPKTNTQKKSVCERV